MEKIEPKTKKMVDVIDKLELNGKNAQVLLIMPSGNQFANIVKAGRNIKGITVTSANLINTYEVLVNKRILFMKSSIDSLKETFLK